MLTNMQMCFRRAGQMKDCMEWYRMYTEIDVLKNEKTFSKINLPSPQALGPHGTVITESDEIEIGFVISMKDASNVISVMIFIEGELDPVEREVITWNVTKLLGLEMEQLWNINIFEKCVETFFTSGGM